MRVLQLFNVGKGTATYFKCLLQSSQSNEQISKGGVWLLAGKAGRGTAGNMETSAEKDMGKRRKARYV